METEKDVKTVKAVGYVYFIGARRGPVKIGYTTDPVRRLIKLQAGSPQWLVIHAMHAGTKEDERAYHTQFTKERLHGEWFERSEAVAATMNAIPYLSLWREPFMKPRRARFPFGSPPETSHAQ